MEKRRHSRPGRGCLRTKLVERGDAVIFAVAVGVLVSFIAVLFADTVLGKPVPFGIVVAASTLTAVILEWRR